MATRNKPRVRRRRGVQRGGRGAVIPRQSGTNRPRGRSRLRGGEPAKGGGVRHPQPAVRQETPRRPTRRTHRAGALRCEAPRHPSFVTAETGDEGDATRMAPSMETLPAMRMASSAETAHTTRVAPIAETARTARACQHQRSARATVTDWGRREGVVVRTDTSAGPGRSRYRALWPPRQRTRGRRTAPMWVN